MMVPYGNECIDVKEGATGNVIEKNYCAEQMDPNSGCYGSRGSGNIFRYYFLAGSVCFWPDSPKEPRLNFSPIPKTAKGRTIETLPFSPTALAACEKQYCFSYCCICGVSVSRLLRLCCSCVIKLRVEELNVYI